VVVDARRRTRDMCWRRSFPASASPDFFWEAEFSDRSEVLGTLWGPEKAVSNSFKGKDMKHAKHIEVRGDVGSE